jgi:hypothetical protein
MFHLYSALLLVVIAVNTLAVLLGAAIAFNDRKRDH